MCLSKFLSTETPSTSPALVWFEKEDPYHMVSIKYSTNFSLMWQNISYILQIIWHKLLLVLSTARAWSFKSDVGPFQSDHEWGKLFCYLTRKRCADLFTTNVIFAIFINLFYSWYEMTNFAILFNIFIFDKDAKVDISLWGYRETSIEPELVCALLLSFKLIFFFLKKSFLY